MRGLGKFLSPHCKGRLRGTCERRLSMLRGACASVSMSRVAERRRNRVGAERLRWPCLSELRTVEKCDIVLVSHITLCSFCAQDGDSEWRHGERAVQEQEAFQADLR